MTYSEPFSFFAALYFAFNVFCQVASCADGVDSCCSFNLNFQHSITSYRGFWQIWSLRKMSLKVTDILNRFRGDSDVSVWHKQAHLAKELLKLDDSAVVIPLFLNGPAFAV